MQSEPLSCNCGTTSSQGSTARKIWRECQMAQKPKTVIFPTFLLENLFMTVVAGGTVTLNIPAIYEGLLLMRLTKNDEK